MRGFKYRDKDFQTSPITAEVPYMFDSNEQFLKDMQEKAINDGLQYIEELEFANSSTYKGCILNRLRHGPGVQTWPNGMKYEGEWYADQRSG